MSREFIFSALNNFNLQGLLRSKKDFGISVVCFHRVSDQHDYAYPSMPIKTFEGIISYFSRNYSIILPGQLGEPTPKPKIILTFDDGYKDFIENALPILSKYNAAALMNVVTNSVINGEPFWTQKLSVIINRYLNENKKITFDNGREKRSYHLTSGNSEHVALEAYELLRDSDNEIRNNAVNNLLTEEDQQLFPPMMSEQDLVTATKNGIEIGSHSYSHGNLALTFDEEELTKEFDESKRKIEEMIGLPITCFAFPNGLANERLILRAEKAGYKFLFTTQTELYLPIPGSEVQLIPRILLYNEGVKENILRTELFHAKVNKILKNHA